MNLQDFIKENAPKRIKADIVERWNTRIEPTGLHLQGAGGALTYIGQYGTKAGAPKLLQFGQLALDNGYTEFAKPFFVKAAELMGIAVEVSDIGNPNAASGPIKATPASPSFPGPFQPGKHASMQPADAKYPRDFYVSSLAYWGQQKHDGIKLIAFVTPEEVFYQHRSMRITSMPHPEIDYALRQLAYSWSPMVVEGELTHIDIAGGEHRTASQALTANGHLGRPDTAPQTIFYIFNCVWRASTTQGKYGDMAMDALHLATEARTDMIQPVHIAKTPAEKLALARAMEGNGHEGEVWFKPAKPYTSGKGRDDTFVRTKYLTEMEVRCIGFTPTTAPDHAFGAMLIETVNGEPLGSIGTGFTLDEKEDLLSRFSKHGPFLVDIRTQGFTEDGKVWHGRYIGG